MDLRDAWGIKVLTSSAQDCSGWRPRLETQMCQEPKQRKQVELGNTCNFLSSNNIRHPRLRSRWKKRTNIQLPFRRNSQDSEDNPTKLSSPRLEEGRDSGRRGWWHHLPHQGLRSRDVKTLLFGNGRSLVRFMRSENRVGDWGLKEGVSRWGILPRSWLGRKHEAAGLEGDAGLCCLPLPVCLLLRAETSKNFQSHWEIDEKTGQFGKCNWLSVSKISASANLTHRR